jgi:succinate dehydrogenase / fumarate reductase, cytochrome b subunit
MTARRPFFLNLLLIRQPVGAVASILHRASGALLALLIPLLLYGLMRSLESEDAFLALRAWGASPLGQLVLLGVIWATAHHFFAGLRHLGFDLGLGESRSRSRLTAWLSLVLGGAVTALAALGMWL